MRYYLKTLGRLSLHPGEPHASHILSDSKSLAVLAYVAAAPGREVRRSHLAGLIWPEASPKHGRRSLRQAIYYLSQRADDGLFLTDNGVLAPNPDRVVVDLWRFDRALEQEDWEEVVRIYEGEFLGGFGVEGGREFESWRESQNHRIWGGLKAAYYRLVEEALGRDQHERAVRFGEEYVALNPLDSTAQCTLIRAHLHRGDRVSAYRAYEEYRGLLREALDEAPPPELRERVAQIREELFSAGPARAPDPSRLERVQHSRETLVSTPPVERAPPRERDEENVSPADAIQDEGVDSPAGGSSDKATKGKPGTLWSWGTAVLGAGVVLGIGLTSLIVSATTSPDRSGERHQDIWNGATGSLLLQSASGRWTDLEVEGGTGNVGKRVHKTPVLWRPDGKLALVSRSTLEGPDVAVVDRSGDTLEVTDNRADEGALDWAPDGRHALLWRGTKRRDGEGIDRHLVVMDLESGREITIDSLSLGRTPHASWSPRGLRIAVHAKGEDGNLDLYLADADLERVRRLTADPGDARTPAWSPGGSRLAYSLSDGEDYDLHLISADGQDSEQITFGAADDRNPVWMSAHHLAFVSDREGGSDVWVIDLQTRSLRRITEMGDVRRLLETPSSTGAHVKSVSFHESTETVVPGQRFAPRISAHTAAGRRLSPESLPLEWTVSEPGVARMENGGSDLRVTGTGAARVVVSAGGWVADTLTLQSVPLETRMLSDPGFEETWSSGLAKSRWIEFGVPRPEVVVRDTAAVNRPGLQLPDSVFVNNGDENYSSGVVSRRTFASGRGLTVEFQARLPFGGSVWQGLHVGFVPEPPQKGSANPRSREGGTVLSFGGEGRPRAMISWPEGRMPLRGEILEPNGWNRYALQIEPDGTVSVVLGDSLRWRSSDPVVEKLLDQPLHLLIGGRSHRTRIATGRVRIWPGVRYRAATSGR